jgi:endonuclease/exonuclease/phosphatase family metal-dependent hydrolase
MRITVLACGLLVLALAGPAAEGAAAQAGSLRAMTWNIESARTYKSGWANVIGNQKPDVAALQEVCHLGSNKTTKIIGEVKQRFGIDYQPVYGLVPDAGVFGCTQFGNVLLVKKGIAIAQKGMVVYRSQFASGDGTKRSYAWANLRTAKGLVTVSSTHLQNGLSGGDAGPSLKARQAQAAELAQGTGRGAARQIVMGDFNAGVNGPELKAFRAQKFADVDAACWAGKKCTATQDSGAKIDYILHRGFKASGFAVHGSPSSDHNVVVANLG